MMVLKWNISELVCSFKSPHSFKYSQNRFYPHFSGHGINILHLRTTHNSLTIQIITAILLLQLNLVFLGDHYKNDSTMWFIDKHTFLIFFCNLMIFSLRFSWIINLSSRRGRLQLRLRLSYLFKTSN